MTNADRIRQMSDQELARLFEPLCMNASEICKEEITYECPQIYTDVKCSECWLDWLKQEVQE